MNLGRPKEFDTEKVLDAAMQQFWQSGYEATSLQDLLNGMGLSKSSFYQTFGNKHQLFLSCINNYQRKTAKELTTRLESSPAGMEFIQYFLAEVVSEASLGPEKKGCFLVNTISELCPQDERIADAVSAAIHNLNQVFLLAIERCKREGSIRSEVNSELLVNYLMTNICGLRTMVKGGASKEILNQVNQVIMSVLR